MLILSVVVLMGGATTAIGFLPTYAEIGIWAPILLLLIRLFQGFSVGGEFTGSVSYLIETAPMRSRGFAGSFANIGSTAGYLLAAGLAAGTVMLSKAHPEFPWIWRLPFIGGGTAPLIATALIDFTGHKLAAAGYLMVGALMSIGALYMMYDRSREPLR